MKRVMQTALLVGLSLFLSACTNSRDDTHPDTDGGSSGTDVDSPGTGGTPPGTGGAGGDPIAWGPRLDGSDLSPVIGAEDDFGQGVSAAVMRAARAVPNMDDASPDPDDDFPPPPRSVSQSSRVEDGRTADAMSAHVGRGVDGNLVHEVTDRSRIAAQVPAPMGLPRQDLDLALFTTLIPGIEPDLSSYPHEVLGMWAWEGGAEGMLEVGAFWSSTQPIPEVEFGAASPTGTATYDGDAVGLHAASGAATKFLADVEMSADFGDGKVSGEVNGFRSLSGAALDIPAVGLGETAFSSQGDPFAGATTMTGVAGSGQWGARWSDGEGWTMGGTFGFAADDGSVGVLGAFTAGPPASTDGANPDDPVATNP